MIKMTASQYHCNNNNQLSSFSILIVYRHHFAFNCLLLLSSLIVVPIASEYNNISTTKSTDSNDSIDANEFTTSYTFLNPITLVSNNANLITDLPLTISNLSTIKLNSTSFTTNNNTGDTNETTDSIVTIKSTVTTTTTSPNHVNLFLDGEDEVNTLPATINTTDPIDSILITSNQLTNSSLSLSPSPSPPSPPPSTTTTTPIPTTINSNDTFKLSTKLPTIKDNETTTPPAKSTINSSNQSNHDSITESPLTTTLTTGMINGTTNIDNTRSSSYNLTTIESTTDLLIDNSTVICDHKNADHNNNQRVAIDHYEAKKFLIFTVILLGLCCLLVLIVLILIFYVFRKLTRERKIKIPQVNAANQFNRTEGGGSIEFDTIKEGHNFYHWQGNVNNGFESSDLNESTTQSTGYRFLDGSVVPFTDRYNDLKTSSTDTFGHPPHHQHQLQPSLQPKQETSLSSPSINSLPKSATITTVDTRL